MLVPMDLNTSNFLAAVYFVAVATFAAFVGQHVVRRLIIMFGRASLIIFILASTIFVSAISLGEFYLPYYSRPGIILQNSFL